MPTNPLRRITLMSRQRKIATGLGAVGVAGAVVLGGASLASADTSTSTTPGSSSSSSSDTAVTGAEATKVSAAVTAEDSAVTVTEVRKDPDGSYDVLGTKAGAEVFYDVSSDLATVTLNSGRGGHHRHGGGSSDTAVTGAEATKASAAVTAQDSAVTVTEVRKDPDGSYDVLGTKAGAEVFYDVSSDLATVTLNAGHGGDHADGDGETNDDTTGATGASSAAA